MPPCPFHRKPADAPADPAIRAKIVAALNAIDFAKLDDQHKLDLVRVYHVLFNRFGMPTASERAAVLAKFDPAFPTGGRFVNAELGQLLVYLDAPSAAGKLTALLKESPTQEEQIEFVRSLRALKGGWTSELRKDYFTWFLKAANYKGGNSFQKFLALIKADAVATLSDAERVALQPVLDATPATAKLPVEAPRPFVKAWAMPDLTPTWKPG